MKAVLQYIDMSNDKRWFYGILAANNIRVIKEKYCIDFRRKVTISIKDYSELNDVVRELNEKTNYGVSVVKVFEKSFIKKLFWKVTTIKQQFYGEIDHRKSLIFKGIAKTAF